uniref:Uncharacterized protein n=1 Tax=Globisporangium ultimum (strain ATCC 200006 / CBS 805.95 / DAOM BR144) TaxID=431595 RepID=K3X0C2_GLOUD
MASRPRSSNLRSAPLQGTLRPQSAAVLLQAPSRHVSQQAATVSAAVAAARSSGALPLPSGCNAGKVGASSEDLIRDLEHKVRKVVEQKRSESDKLRFALAKKREEVEKTKLVLQDLIKESEALGLHFQSLSSLNNNQMEDPAALSSVRASRFSKGDDPSELQFPDGAHIVEEPGRLQPIASISRRPLYSKHSNINELEAKLEKRASETHQVHRRTLMLEHIRKRLLSEQIEISQETNELKAQYADISQETQELHKKEIAAVEAVSQVQSRLAQQKEEIVANLRKYNREVTMRQKWAREKANFEKYYSEQSAILPAALDEEEEKEFREAFLRIGFGMHGERVDPEEVIRICLSHEELKKELDAKHDEEFERVAQLRQSIVKMKGVVMENNPLSKRGTSQRLENKEVEISAVERSLATVVDQYMFVDQSVRPIKIGLQQILQNVTNETVNVDDMESLEKSLLESCEEMMRLIRESSDPELVEEPDRAAGELDSGDDNNASHSEVASPSKEAVFSPDNFTSPFNIRIPPKRKEPYYVPGINQEPPAKVEDSEHEETDFDVMDRVTVKRISSVIMCTSTGKKTKDKGQQSFGSHRSS